jgi:hypothetical protein
MNNHYVYFHRKSSDGSIFYVGIGNGRRAYKKSYRSELWNRFVSKYGLIVDIVDSGITIEIAKELEIKYINEFGRISNGTGCLVNLTDGGDGRTGYKCSDETKLKISKANTGKRHTAETKKIISENTIKREAWKHLPKHKSESHKKKLSESRIEKYGRRIHIDGSEFRSIKEASLKFNMSSQKILHRLNARSFENWYYL